MHCDTSKTLIKQTLFSKIKTKILLLLLLLHYNLKNKKRKDQEVKINDQVSALLITIQKQAKKLFLTYF